MRTVAFCVVDGCERPRYAKAMCTKHYQRWQSHGDPSIVLRPFGRTPGQGWVGPDGYRYVSVVGRRPMLEHRLAMEQILDRELLSNESVHHKNGDRADNRPQNLELWSERQPAGQRVVDKAAWAKELLALYEPAALAETDMPFWAMSP